jgi:hypothetical protein
MIGLNVSGGALCFYRLICQSRCDQVLFGGLEKTDQLRQTPLVRVAGGTVTVGPDPLRVLNPQVFVNLLPKLTVRMNLVRHYSFLNQGLGKTAFALTAQDTAHGRLAAIARAWDFALLLEG